MEPLRQLMQLAREKLAQLDRAERLLYLAIGMSALALWRSAPKSRSRYRRKALR